MQMKTRRSARSKCSQVSLYEEFRKDSNNSDENFKSIVQVWEEEILMEASKIKSLNRKARRSNDYLNYEDISSRCDRKDSEHSSEKKMLCQLNLENMQLGADQCLKTLGMMQELRKQKINRFFEDRNYTSDQLQEFLVQMATTLPLFPPYRQNVAKELLELVGGIPLSINKIVPVGSFVAVYHDALGLWVLARVKDMLEEEIYLLDDIDENKKKPEAPNNTYRVKFAIDEHEETVNLMGDILDVHQMFVINLMRPEDRM